MEQNVLKFKNDIKALVAKKKETGYAGTWMHPMYCAYYILKHKVENKVLDKVNSPEDIRKLNNDEKKVLCQELRDFIIKNVSKTGGHLASSLGDVELTVAMEINFS